MTRYVVLRRVPMAHDAATYEEVDPGVAATNDQAAIREATKGLDADQRTGTFVAVPVRSFKPRHRTVETGGRPMELTAQNMQALALANEVRLAGCSLRARLARDEITLEQALEHPDAGAQKIGRMLAAQPRWGKVRSARLLRVLQISEWRRVADLTDRQRAQIVAIAADPQRRNRRAA